METKKSVHLTVVPAAEAVTIEATTALTIILICAFAIDRLVTVLMFLLRARRRGGTSKEEEVAKNLESDKKRERLIYILLAGILGLLLGYFGNIRLLEGLGFSNDVWVNVILTALITTAGSDSIAMLMKRMGIGSGPEAESKPLEVRGNLVLERTPASKEARSKAGGA